MRLIRHTKNEGVALARNTLLDAARGEFIAYFDDDDESYPHRLSKQWERIAEYERLHRCEDVFCTAVREVAINGRIDHTSTALGQVAPEPNGRMVADYLLGVAQMDGIAWGLFGTCVLMARVSVLRKLGGFDPEFRRCAEWDMAIRAAFNGAHFIAVNEPLVIQHKTKGAEKSGTMPLQYSLRLREKHKQYLQQRGLYKTSRAMARSNFHGSKGRVWKSRLYAVLARLFSPIVLRETIARRLGR
jgi:glycosyltransferase involved in cell wall biosynthesis